MEVLLLKCCFTSTETVRLIVNKERKGGGGGGYGGVVVEVLLYVHRNRRFVRDGSPERPPGLSHTSSALLWRWGEREIIYLSLHCHHHNDSCMKMDSDETNFNVC